MTPETERSSLAGLLATLAPFGAVVLAWRWRSGAEGLELLGIATLCTAAVALFLAGLWLLRPLGGSGRVQASVAVGLIAVAILMPSPTPAQVLATLIVAGILFARIWPQRLHRTRRRTPGMTISRARGAGMGGLLVLGWALATGWTADPLTSAAFGLVLAVPPVLGVRSATLPQDRALVRVGLLIGVGGAALLRPAPLLGLVLLAVPSAVFVVLGARRGPTTRPGGILASLVEQPARILVVTFAVVSLLGAALLRLPAFSASREPTTMLDALFTSISATCVNGLIVLDTPTHFSWAGEALILLLIQVGGLGIMTFATAAFVLLGRRMSVRQESAAAGLIGAEGAGSIARALRRMLALTVLLEGLGALALSALFVASGDPVGTALWRGLFTAISAFCNAGFALQTDSLISYAGSPLILLVVSMLVILGGLGPPVVASLPAWWRGRPVPVQVRLILWTTALLLVVSTVLYAGLEWERTLAGLSAGDKLVGAWFQAGTPRSGGFVSADIAHVARPTWLMLLVLMFIGGSPGSTAGGVKTTTVAILALSVLAAIRGRPEAEVFGRRLSHDTVYKAAAILAVGLASTALLVFALLLTQTIPLDRLVFEAISAMATVGLSMGATAELDPVGKVLVMVAMFVGRVGPLTLFLLLVERRVSTRVGLPEEEVAVG